MTEHEFFNTVHALGSDAWMLRHLIGAVGFRPERYDDAIRAWSVWKDTRRGRELRGEDDYDRRIQLYAWMRQCLGPERSSDRVRAKRPGRRWPWSRFPRTSARARRPGFVTTILVEFDWR